MKSTSDFAAIEAFARVAEAGSFRTAALSLGAPASTISIRVSRLEKSISAFVAELKAFLDVWPGCLAPSAR